MIRRLVVVGALVAAGATVFAGASSAKVIAKCKPDVAPGTELVGKTVVRTYCGHAKATMKQQGKATSFTNGLCIRWSTGFLIGIGKVTTTTSGAKPLYKSFLTSVPLTKDGRWKTSLIRYQLPGKEVYASGSLALTGKRTRGTFSGRIIKNNSPTGPTVTVTFSCK